MARLLTFITLIMGVGLTLTTPTPTPTDEVIAALSLTRHGRSCVVNYRIYKHAQVFTIGNTRCVKYICDDGNYHIFEEGCDKWNQCWPANREFQYMCRSYMCLVTQVGSYKKYEVRPSSSQMCRDAFGRCWHPGQRFFFVMEGRLRTDCSCRPGRINIHYYCYN